MEHSVTTITEAITEAGHRERLLEGMAVSIRERGFLATSIADVVRHARTSRRTFYEHFADKEACYVELVRVAGAILREQVQGAVDPAADWEVRIDQAVDSYIAALSGDPRLTITFFRELPVLGKR